MLFNKVQPISFKDNPYEKIRSRNPISSKRGQHYTVQKLSYMRRPAFPIPKGETPYALAKSAEYKDRDLESAEYYYKKAIAQGDRTESAVKDLASLLHQRGKTQRACEILENFQYLFKSDHEKYQNLYNTLKKQLDCTSSCKHKVLKLSGLSGQHTQAEVLKFFTNPIRIKKLDMFSEVIEGKLCYFAMLTFISHSSARKTLEGYGFWESFKVEWVSPTGEIVGDAHYVRNRMQEQRKHHPVFEYKIFERDPNGYVYCMPIDESSDLLRPDEDYEDIADKLLGSGLYTTIIIDNTHLE